MNRSYVRLFGWDNSSVKVPVSYGSSWFSKRHGNRCVVGCKNYPDILHLSDNGLANISYCITHAELRILKDLVNGHIERGLWVYCIKGKLKPFWVYSDYIKLVLNSIKNPKQKIQLNIISQRVKQFKKDGKLKK